ncbi:MAG: hypothetical protein IJ375_06730 [Oscillospiraceae bacterium]|nr:hypothetical protein [Oscillospiraceae bacterium]
MTLTRKLLDTEYIWWFHNKRHVEQAKQEILELFSEEPDETHEWTEQDIYEQSRKIIARWDNA